MRHAHSIARSGRLIAAVLAAILPSLAMAHAGHDHTAGFMAGLTHPFSGVDHMLAMVAVGLLAGRLGGAALWQVPTSFVAMMACGTMLGMAHIPLPIVETGIAISIVVFGALLASSRPLTVATTTALVACFALFHGHAHGTEAAADISGTAYAAGLMWASALLHLGGVLIAVMLMRVLHAQGEKVLQIGGGAIAAAGVAVFAGIL